jgi:hypothetical protein
METKRDDLLTHDEAILIPCCTGLAIGTAKGGKSDGGVERAAGRRIRGYKDIPERVILEYSALFAMFTVSVSLAVTTAPDIGGPGKLECAFYNGGPLSRPDKGKI